MTRRHTTRALLTGLVTVLTALTIGHAADAADSVPVIELFTSQGCSSCPSADKLFEAYARRTDVVALSMAVDYWDYLGWKDTLASPKFTARQRDYAHGRGDGQVYTPQVIVNGRDHVVGSSAKSIEQSLARSADALRSAPVSMEFSADGRSVEIIAQDAATRTAQAAILWIVAVSPKQRVKIERGENRGRELMYYNVVRDITSVGTWTGGRVSLPVDRAKLPTGEGIHYAALLQSGRGGPLIAAAWLD